MAYMLRGPSVSYNSLYGGSGNTDLFQTLGFFDFVIPSDWDNTSSPPSLTVAFVGGVVADGTAPTDFEVFAQFGIHTVNGGSAVTSAPYCSNGNSYAIGSLVRGFQTNGLASWESVGLGQTASGSVFPTATSNHSATLIDGAAYGHSGEGFVNGSTKTGPLGWLPNCDTSFTNDGTAQAKLIAGQTATFWIGLFSDCTDNVNRDRSVYGVLQSVTLTYKSTSYPIDLTAVKVGWNLGGSYTNYFGSPGGTVYPNPLRTVELTVPPMAHPNAQSFIDFYLTSAGGQRVQATIF